MPKLFQISLCVLNASVGGITKQIGEKAIEHGWNSFITYTDQLEHVDCSSKLIKIGNKFDFYEHAIESLGRTPILWLLLLQKNYI